MQRPSQYLFHRTTWAPHWPRPLSVYKPIPSTSVIELRSPDTHPPQRRLMRLVPSLLPSPESLRDPFTGMTVGILSPISSTKCNSSSEELWAHLSRIRSLQPDMDHLRLTIRHRTRKFGHRDMITFAECIHTSHVEAAQ